MDSVATVYGNGYFHPDNQILSTEIWRNNEDDYQIDPLKPHNE